MRIHEVTADELGVDPALHLATTYRREIRAGVHRIWENLFDWEHLPVLHEGLFNRVELLDLNDDGWQVKLTRQPGDASRMQVLELEIDKPQTRYRVTTLEGTGRGTQIHTLLQPLDAQRTAIEVRYYLPEHRPEKVDVLGEKYRCSCQQLWDEDEAMMMQREHMTGLGSSPTPFAQAPLSLGPLPTLREKLPLRVEFGGQAFRLIEDAGELIAHAAVCPHWMGPLDTVPVKDGCVRCPWHGYLFDVRSGDSTDGRGLRLARAPNVFVDRETQEVTLVGSGV